MSMCVTSDPLAYSDQARHGLYLRWLLLLNTLGGRCPAVVSVSTDFHLGNETVSCMLLDRDGRAVSVGSGYVLVEDIEPGELLSF